MKTLNKLVQIGKLKVPDFKMDHFQIQILKNLYLEFFLENSRAIIKPNLQIMTTGKATPGELDDLTMIINEHADIIEKIKKYLIYDLSLYSALLETNSYYLSLNNYLLISRFLKRESDEDSFEIKLYTIQESELPHNFSDKLYIGRDILSIKTFNRQHFSLKFKTDSFNEQMEKMKARIIEQVSINEGKDLDQEYLQDITDTLKEFTDAAESIMREFPSDLTSKEVETSTLIEVNRRFRDIKHILIELEVSLNELENKMFQKELMHPVRYVTKFKKDVTNAINFIMYKVNGRISDYVNDIHI